MVNGIHSHYRKHDEWHNNYFTFGHNAFSRTSGHAFEKGLHCLDLDIVPYFFNYFVKITHLTWFYMDLYGVCWDLFQIDGLITPFASQNFNFFVNFIEFLKNDRFFLLFDLFSYQHLLWLLSNFTKLLSYLFRFQCAIF